MKHFRPTRGRTVIRQMLRLKQKGTIVDYREQFGELSAEVPHMTNDVLEEIFLHGKKNLKEQVVRYMPMVMDDIVDMTKMIEDQEWDRGNLSPRPFQRTSPTPVLNQPNRSHTQIYTKDNELVLARRSFDLRRDYKVTGGSSDNRRFVHNPCRHCGERYFAGHRCKTQHQFKCLEVDEGDEQEVKIMMKMCKN